VPPRPFFCLAEQPVDLAALQADVAQRAAGKRAQLGPGALRLEGSPQQKQESHGGSMPGGAGPLKRNSRIRRMRAGHANQGVAKPIAAAAAPLYFFRPP
jgi:hypothetical protein